jgi:SAM-dependent methyltransferase
MQLSSKTALMEWLDGRLFQDVLDAPCGKGWLREALGPKVALDGIDLYANPSPAYRRLWHHDLNDGLPPDAPAYTAIFSCEGIEHLGNPLRLLGDCLRHLVPGGLLVVTTPNTWYPQARLQFWQRGFFPSFPPLAGRLVAGTHMHIMPWNYPQLWVYLRLAGFSELEVIQEPLSRAKCFYERLLAVPARRYCRSRRKKAATIEEQQFWEAAGSDASLLGRHLMVAARRPERA